MRSLAELHPEDQAGPEQLSLSKGWVEELGALIIDETTMLALHDPINPELGWRMEKTAGVMPLPAPLSEPQAVAA
jgi:hypothetical protein